MKQITKQNAVDIHDSGRWKEWSDEYLVYFQLHQKRLCVPWSVFREAIERVLDRGVWTHEFAQPENLRAELEGTIPAPTMEQIVEQLEDMVGPERVIVLEGG